MDTTNLTQVSDNNGLLGQYGYSGDGLRVAKTTAQGTGYFIYDVLSVIQETDANGLTTANYTTRGGLAGSRLLALHDSAGLRVPLVDALGSVRVLLDVGQNFTDGYAYDGFGSMVSGGGSSTEPYRFVGGAGYYQDFETGLALLTYRHYDPVVGRFLTRDPLGFAGRDAVLYGYVKNRPTGRTDSLGLLDWFDVVLKGVSNSPHALNLLKDLKERDTGALSDEAIDAGVGNLVDAAVGAAGAGEGVMGGSLVTAYTQMFIWLWHTMPKAYRKEAECRACQRGFESRPHHHIKNCKGQDEVWWIFGGLSCTRNNVTSEVSVAGMKTPCLIHGEGNAG